MIDSINPLFDFFKLIIIGIIAGVAAAATLTYLSKLKFNQLIKKYRKDIENKVDDIIIYDDATNIEAYLIQAAYNHDYIQLTDILVKYLGEFNKLSDKSASSLSGKLQQFGITFATDIYAIERLLRVTWVYTNYSKKNNLPTSSRFEYLFLILCLLIGRTSSKARTIIGILLGDAISEKWFFNEPEDLQIRYISLLCQIVASMPEEDPYKGITHLVALIKTIPKPLVEKSIKHRFIDTNIADEIEMTKFYNQYFLNMK